MLVIDGLYDGEKGFFPLSTVFVEVKAGVGLYCISG